jgi:hypothetical protein
MQHTRTHINIHEHDNTTHPQTAEGRDINKKQAYEEKKMRKLTGSVIISLVMLAASCSQGIKLTPDMVEKPGRQVPNGEIAGPAEPGS